MKKILSIVLCVVLCFSLFSCKEQGQENEINTPDAQIINTDNVHEFDSIANFKSAVKKDAEKYENMQVSVKGVILKNNGKIVIIENKLTEEQLAAINSGGEFNIRFNKEKIIEQSIHIAVIIPNDKKVAILDDGDYVKISGTVKISDTGIYLDNCDYEMIESIYE